LGVAPYDVTEVQQEAVDLAKRCDVTVLCLGLNAEMEGEALDRESLSLPDDQIELINSVSKVSRKCIVVLNNATPVIMNEWIDSVPVIVEALYPGQEGGRALADILFGDVSPSGRLPLTFIKNWNDSPVAATYPGEKAFANYSEGIFVGYRYFDKNDIEPLFPFGYGLSYTSFSYSNLKVSPQKMTENDTIYIQVEVKNSGMINGDEVVQLYIRDVEASKEREVKALKGFKRVTLKSGESKDILFKLDKNALSFYDVVEKKWLAEPGEFEVMVGSSSRDIRLKDRFSLIE
jgi:beta-glucosidase